MTLPAYLPPMVATQSQMVTSLNDTGRNRAPVVSVAPVEPLARMKPSSGSPAIARALLQPDQTQATDTAVTGGQKAPSRLNTPNASGEQEVSAPSIRTASGETLPVDLPVPVTQILKLVLGDAPDPIALGSVAKSLYEGVQSIMTAESRAEPPPNAQAAGQLAA